MKHNINSIFKIPGFRIKDVLVNGWEITLSVKSRRKTALCPRCQRRSSVIHDYRPSQKVLHQILGTQKIYLLFQKRRFECLNCPRVFTERYPFLEKWQRRTKEVKNYALYSLSGQCFRTVEEKLGVGYHSLVSYLKKLINLQDLNWGRQRDQPGDLKLGIDEHHVKKNVFVTTIADLRQGEPLAILPEVRQLALVRFLQAIPQDVKERITEVATDMRESFIQAVKLALPQARVVIDHFHVIQEANRKLQEARLIEQDVEEKIKAKGKVRINWRILLKAREHLNPQKGEEKLLEHYLQVYPILAEFYFFKEGLREMYQLEEKPKAREKLEALITLMKKSEHPSLWSWARTLKRYEEEILNYFDNKTTNAVTEGLHRKFKMIQRQAYGFRNLEVYVRRVMFAFLPLTLLRCYPHI